MIYLFILIILFSILSGWFVLWKVPLIHTNQQKYLKNKKLTIIIPARNEEKKLPILLESLNKQRLQPYEVLVVDDDSSDNTAEVAREYNARVINFLPDAREWVGKSAACYYGAVAAKGDYFLFLDADVFLAESTSLEKIMKTFYAKKDASALSIQPYHVVEKVYENLSVVFNVLVLAGMNQFSVFEEKFKPAGAFGPSLLIDRETYFKVDGHKSIRGSIMENIDLGKVLLKEGVSVYLYGGKNSLHFRMYPDGYSSLAEGWSKSFASGSKATHPLILFEISLWIAGAFVTPAFVFYGWLQGDTSLLIWSIMGSFLYYIQFLRMSAKVGSFSPWVLLFYPLLFIYFVLLFTWSAIKTTLFKKVSWKGRDINLEEEEDVD